MSSRLVEDRRLPDPVSGHPALELCNTRAGWGSATPKEYLLDGRALALWGWSTGLLDAVGADAPSRVLAATLDLRDALYAVLTAEFVEPAETGTPGLDRVLGHVREAVGRARYVAREGTVVLRPGSGPQETVDAAALAAQDLLLQHGPGAVGRCPGVGCGWLFLDPTRRRRWCVMAICGNRAKARRHAASRRGRPVP